MTGARTKTNRQPLATQLAVAALLPQVGHAVRCLHAREWVLLRKALTAIEVGTEAANQAMDREGLPFEDGTL